MIHFVISAARRAGPALMAVGTLALAAGAADPAAAQSLSVRPASMELDRMSVAEFARSLQIRSADGERIEAACMAILYDSEGEAWSAWTSDAAATVGGGRQAGCWSAEVAELLPEGRFGPADRVLSPGLIVNADFLTAHAIPVTADVPVDPFIISEEVRSSTPGFQQAMEEVEQPLERTSGVASGAEWVALSFIVVPMSERRRADGDSGGPLSEDFESRPVTVLIGKRTH